MSDSENGQGVKVTCDICGEYEGTEKQVFSGHKPRCKEKRAKEAAMLDSEPNDGEETNAVRVEDAEPTPESTTETNMPEAEPVVAREREIPDRKERVPLGVRRQKLAAPVEPGYQYRWMNDGWQKDPNRIAAAEAGGYVHVEGVEPRVVGSNDTGKPIIARLMRIPQELYDEDQAEKQREIDEKEQAVNDGSFGTTPGDKRYVPDGAANRG
jgi:hypothetical protein